MGITLSGKTVSILKQGPFLITAQSVLTWYWVYASVDNVEHESYFELTKDTLYLALMGELWSVCCEYFGENWPCFNSLGPSDTIWRQIWVNIGSGNGLLPDGTKPLPEPMLTDHQWSQLTFILGQFHKRCLNCLKITYLKFHSNFPGANELIRPDSITIWPFQPVTPWIYYLPQAGWLAVW